MENIEIWKPVVGYENLYEISSFGNVRRLYKNGASRILKPCKNNYGYLHVHLSKNSIAKTILVHILVAEAFVPNPLNKPTVNHIDENKTNNCVSNLAWATVKEQINHGTRTSRVAEKQKGVKRGTNLKLCKPIICVESNLLYNSATEAERLLNINDGNIALCCKGLRKTAGGFHWQYA